MVVPSALSNKTVYVCGGSSGLGKEIAKALVAEGAHATIFARRQGALDEAREEILSVSHGSQDVKAVSLDLANASQVDEAFRSQSRLPDIVYCVAGGTPTECGFFADIGAAELESCMRSNYFTAAYAAQAALKMWTEDDHTMVWDKDTREDCPRLRQIVFINSVGALFPVPGYTAYTPSKCAVRGLADTLRMEALRYSGPKSTYTVHCAFPSNFISPAFVEEMKRKPELTKQIEGTTGSMSQIEKKFPSADKVAVSIIAGVRRGDFAICDDSMESGLLWANMIGTSPKRGLGIVDSLYAILVGLFVWPIMRRYFDALCRKA